MFIISIYLVISPVIDDPSIDYLGAIGVLLAGLVFYVPFVHFKYEIPYYRKKKIQIFIN
jgi:L-type amino acid transporter 9